LETVLLIDCIVGWKGEGACIMEMRGGERERERERRTSRFNEEWNDDDDDEDRAITPSQNQASRFVRLPRIFCNYTWRPHPTYPAKKNGYEIGSGYGYGCGVWLWVYGYMYTHAHTHGQNRPLHEVAEPNRTEQSNRTTTPNKRRTFNTTLISILQPLGPTLFFISISVGISIGVRSGNASIA
jgi:hypothetical protein